MSQGDDPDRLAKIQAQEQWHRHMQPFEALQSLRARLGISLLRERNQQSRQFIGEAMDRIEKIQERLSLELMRIDFERWQDYVKLDTEELAEIVKASQKHGDTTTAAEVGGLIMKARIIVNAERKF